MIVVSGVCVCVFLSLSALLLLHCAVDCNALIVEREDVLAALVNSAFLLFVVPQLGWSISLVFLRRVSFFSVM